MVTNISITVRETKLLRIQIKKYKYEAPWTACNVVFTKMQNLNYARANKMPELFQEICQRRDQIIETHLMKFKSKFDQI